MYSKPTKLVLSAGHCWIAWLLEISKTITVGSVADIWPKVQTCGRKSGRFGRIPDFIRISNKVVFSEMQSL